MKIVFGGFPCTSFSIAQKNSKRVKDLGFTADEFIAFRADKEHWWKHIDDFERSVGEKHGIEKYAFSEGIQLMLNCCVVLDRFKPDFYLFENVASMAKEVRLVITEIFKKVYGGFVIQINAARVSAQNRKRLYWTNFKVSQPRDRHIYLKDVLESGVGFKGGDIKKGDDGKSYAVLARVGGATPRHTAEKHMHTMVAEPVCLRYERTEVGKKLRKEYESGRLKHKFNEHKTLQPRSDKKSNTLTTVAKDNRVATPVKVFLYPNKQGRQSDCQAMRVYSHKFKAVCLQSGGGGGGARTGLYAIPLDKFNRGSTFPDGKIYDVYAVKNRHITVNEKTYPVKLQDGFYIIRTLFPVECERLMTLPDGYTEGISTAQRLKALGNGWVAEVIVHILDHAIGEVPKTEFMDVISLYDGIGTARYCLDKMGFTSVNYVAYEIDKHAKKVSRKNYEDIQHYGDAMQVRE